MVVATIAGLLTWQAVALAVSFLALILATVAIYRSSLRDAEVAAWKTDQLVRAEAQGAALSDDLRED